VVAGFIAADEGDELESRNQRLLQILSPACGARTDAAGSRPATGVPHRWLFNVDDVTNPMAPDHAGAPEGPQHPTKPHVRIRANADDRQRPAEDVPHQTGGVA
jgi:hypothetical protein